jgi:type IV secretory pathway VirB10-like protein
MTGSDGREPPRGAGSVGPESLELRARPQPVTRINRKVVIGAAAVLLFLISCIVLVALKPPSFRVAGPQELFNVERKPITDALAKLPATYDGIKPDKKVEAGKQPPASVIVPQGVPELKVTVGDGLNDAERAEKARLARLAGQARESQVFFRLQLKPPPKKKTAAEARPDPVAPPPPPAPTDGGLAALTVLRAADRALALAGGDLDLLGTGTADQARKLTFLKSGPEKEILNPHRLQTPVSPYQLMAGTVIAASLVTGLNSDLPGFVIAQVTEHVYDSVSGRFLLIPQGSRLVSKYDNIVAFGQ